ncbi:YceI family protein [Sungkyunkwania multivorans]|uniref:YceI family protein n=1 Tax=Sungkyunkwania multivorans TaxID=1173618 RepID=A0ABW3CW76_9FLAO
MKKVSKEFVLVMIWFGLLFGVFSLTLSVAQEQYLDKNGVLIFEASEKLFEEVKATNKSVTTIYDTATNKIASLALMKGFHFKNSLMEEHFNENYIESGTYPKAKFRGTLIDFDPKADLNKNGKKVRVKGTLEVRGKEKDIDTTLDILKVQDIISITGEFVVSPADFDIEIPGIVRNKIAKEVKVMLDFKLKRK